MTESLLHAYAYGGNLSGVQGLLETGAPVELLDDHGNTPLIQAACFSAPVTRLLLERGADPRAVNASDWSAVHYAAHWGNTAALELLLAAGADPVALDRATDRIAALALESGSRATVELLRRAGIGFDESTAEAVMTRSDRGGPRLAVALGLIDPQRVVGGHSAWSRALERKDVPALVDMVVSRGCDPNVRGPGGVSCLHLAIRARDPVAFEALRAAGADLDAVDHDGATLWSQLHGTGDAALISRLADIVGDRPRRRARPLDWAWNAGGNGPHLCFTVTIPDGDGPTISGNADYDAGEQYAEDATGIAIVRFWGSGGASHHDEIRRFLRDHRDVRWSIHYGGDGYPPGTIAHGEGAASLEAYLNLVP